MINTDKLNIRAYESSDLDDLITCFRLNVPEYFDEKEEKDLLDFINHDRQHFFVAEDKG